MNECIWIHEKALSESLCEKGPRAVHVWDEEYYKKRGYSFKRLLFIFETLCELPVEILEGDTLELLDALGGKVWVPFTADKEIKAYTQELKNSEILYPEPFAELPENFESRRFFRYWNKAKKSAFKE